MKKVTEKLQTIWMPMILALGIASLFAAPAWAQNDPCNATIVTDDGSMTAQELCDMIAASGANVTVFHTQCYGGDAAVCCNNAGGGGGGGAGCHNSGGSQGELQTYGEYDQGTADALKPGSSSADIHQSGADNTSSSTPMSGGCGGTVGDGDTVITFAGDPNQQDHDMGQQISDQNDNTTNLEGDGSSDGVEGAATAEELAKALAGASGNVWLWISDHGNMGGDSTAGECPGGTTIDLILTFDPSVLLDMWADAGTTAWVFIESLNPFPALLDVVFNGSTYTIEGSQARAHETGEQIFYRYLLEVPEESINVENSLQISNPTETHFSFEAFVDSGPIAKIGGEPMRPDADDIEPRPKDERPRGE